jgi:hypothetical protein
MIVKLQLLCALFILCFAVSCSHTGETIFTKVNPDGTCYREISAQADSAFLVGDTAKNNPFSIQWDSSWDISWQFEGQTKQFNWPLKTWIPDTSLKHTPIWATITKKYSSIAEMSDKFRFHDGQWDSIYSNAHLSKRFRWFVTYYDYSEVFPKLKNIEQVPIGNYLSTDEIRLFFQGGSTTLLNGMNGLEMKDFLDNLDKRKDEWLFRNVFEKQFDVICANLHLIKGKPIHLNQLMTVKDTILKNYQDSGYNSKEEVYIKLDFHFKTRQFSELCMKNEKVFNELKQSAEFTNYFQNEYNYKLLLPGTIIASNGIYAGNDTLSWKINAYRFAFMDYAMVAKSRVINIWAFGITFLFISVLIGGYVYKKHK